MRIPAWLMCGILAAVASACAPGPDTVNPTPAASENGAPPALRETVQAHLAAISARDLDAQLATVTMGDKLILSFPDGERLETRQQFVDARKQWYADDSWTFEGEIVDLIDSPTLGHAWFATVTTRAIRMGAGAAASTGWS